MVLDFVQAGSVQDQRAGIIRLLVRMVVSLVMWMRAEWRGSSSIGTHTIGMLCFVFGAGVTCLGSYGSDTVLS
jgi:hypothetical protein